MAYRPDFAKPEITYIFEAAMDNKYNKNKDAITRKKQ